MDDILRLASDVGKKFSTKKQILVTAESCTGGGIAYAITHIPGSSQWFDCGFVTYSNESKIATLNVPEVLFQMHGAVSMEVAEIMAKNALKKSNGTISISTTGIAGPTGATPTKPVGLVCFGLANSHKTHTEQQFFEGNRKTIREKSIQHALKLLLQFI